MLIVLILGALVSLVTNALSNVSRPMEMPAEQLSDRAVIRKLSSTDNEVSKYNSLFRKRKKFLCDCIFIVDGELFAEFFYFAMMFQDHVTGTLL